MIRIAGDERVGHSLWHNGATAYAWQLSGPWSTQKRFFQARRQSPRHRQFTSGGFENLFDHVLPGVGVCREIGHRRRSRDTSRGIRQHDVLGFLETVLHQQVMKVTLVEDLAAHVRV